METKEKRMKPKNLTKRTSIDKIIFMLFILLGGTFGILIGTLIGYEYGSHICYCKITHEYNGKDIENISLQTPNAFCKNKGYDGGYFGSSTDLQKPLITCYMMKEGWTKYDSFSLWETLKN